MKVSMAQMSPIWLDKNKTKEKIKSFISDAANQKCDLITFGEGLLPGYPFWLSFAGGASFNDKIHKEIHAHYIANSIQIEAGDLDDICKMAKNHQIAIYLGIIERAKNRGSHSLYCSLVYVNKKGKIKSVHRKLQPTYEERLTWAPGDGNGLRTHTLGEFTLGGLNCWENWMPLSRMALYGQGENLHIAVWPGGDSNTHDITKFIAKESRSYVISVSGLMKKTNFPDSTPHLDHIIKYAPETMANGGSCIASPDGEWLVEPQLNEEKLITAYIDIKNVYQERQNFDLAGHYSRPDVTKLTLNRKRQSILNILS